MIATTLSDDSEYKSSESAILCAGFPMAQTIGAPLMKKSDEQYSEQEAQQRFQAALKGALNTPPKPLKSMTPKRDKAQPKKRAK